jgi:hypothetical protein
VLDRAGFFDAESARRWPAGSPDRPQPVAELAGLPGSFVLLAADGAGKSTALESLQEIEPACTAVSLPALDVAGIRDALRRAIRAGGPVYLDALDVAARYVPSLFFVLEDCLTSAPAVGVAWRLACRPAAWDRALAMALDSSLSDFRQLRLLPLTRAAAAGVAAEVTRRPDDFLDAIVRAGLGGLADSPLRLRSAASQWDKTGRLPGSQLSAMRFEVGQLLEETGSRRPQGVPQDRRRRLAGRLAAMTVFGQADRLTAAPQPSPGTLNIADLPSDPEPDGPGRAVTSEELIEVLGTALFDAATDATVGFRHQQYAEFLAAEYVTSRRITRPQVRTLISMNEDGVIPGPMTGCAAWLAVLNVELGRDFAAVNAGKLAESAVEPPEPLRETVIGALLARAAAEDLDTLPHQDLTSLAHPGLEAQLGTSLSGALARPGELWWISRLALAGQCRNVVAGLLREALGQPWAPWARRAAVEAVAALGDDSEVAQVQALAQLSPEDDPDDDVLAAVIAALFPRVLDTTALLTLLRPQRNTNYFGPYRVLLGELSGQIPQGDLPAVLSWASAHAADGEDAYGDLIPRLIQHGWDDAGSPRIRDPLARLLAAVATSRARPRRPGHTQRPWHGSPPGSRRELAVRVAASLPPAESYLLIDLGLLLAPDLGWLIGVLPSLSLPEQDALARCVPQLAGCPTAAEADLILGMMQGHPAYTHTAWLRNTVSTDSPEAQLERQRREREASDTRQRLASRRQQHTQLTVALRDAGDDPGQWWHIARHLAGADSRDLFSRDLTARPGWELLSAAQRQRVLDLGLRYLSVHQLRPSAWMGHPQYPRRPFG